jgi:tetratricopeptide (TPR) repeat protein
MCCGFCAAEGQAGVPTEVPIIPLVDIPSGEGFPATAAEWSELGDSLVEFRGDVEAIKAYEYALLLDPLDAKTWSKYGQILVRGYMYERAREAYHRALALSPDDATTWNNLGSLLFQMGSPAEAVAAFEQAITLDPGYIPQSSYEGHETVQPGSESESTGKDAGFPLIFSINNVLIGSGVIIIFLLSRMSRSPLPEDENDD